MQELHALPGEKEIKMNRRKRYTLCVDFDGTIVEHKFPEIGELKAGVKEAMLKLHDHFDIVISSCRASQLFRKTPTSLSARQLVRIAGEWVTPNSAPNERMDAKGMEQAFEEYLHDCRPKAIPDQQRADGRDYVKEMCDFLTTNGIPFDRIDMGDEGKVVAVAYIDDRAIRYADEKPYGWTNIANAVISIYGEKEKSRGE